MHLGRVCPWLWLRVSLVSFCQRKAAADVYSCWQRTAPHDHFLVHRSSRSDHGLRSMASLQEEEEQRAEEVLMRHFFMHGVLFFLARCTIGDLSIHISVVRAFAALSGSGLDEA
jgi:hypothetical protein